MTEQAQPLRFYTDRSAIETDWKCGMRFWWNRHHDGMGIVATDEQLDLKIGAETHADLQIIAEMDDISPAAIQAKINEILDPLTEEDKKVTNVMELIYRRVGWFAAFALYIEPKIREQFETVSVERELILDRDPLWVAVTPDRVLRHRVDRYLVYKEYKTTISAGPKWTSYWPTAIQAQLGMAALQEELEEEIKYTQIIGLIKGDNRGGRLAHPYVWAYYNASKDEWTHDYTKARSSEWEHMPVWEYPGGVVGWVQKCGAEVAEAQFPHSAPVFFKPNMLEDLIASRIAREYEIKDIIELCQVDWKTRRLYFEKRTSQCQPPFGPACPYRLACFNAQVNSNPIASGVYVKRTPHHEIELTYDLED